MIGILILYAQTTAGDLKRRGLKVLAKGVFTDRILLWNQVASWKRSQLNTITVTFKNLIIEARHLSNFSFSFIYTVQLIVNFNTIIILCY